MSVMAALTYNEVYNTVTQEDGTVLGSPSALDPMFHWDRGMPERLSRLNIKPDFTPLSSSPACRRGARARRQRNAARFKTQPITFDEIKEVDEEPNTMEDAKENLKNQFTVFSRSMDGLVTAPYAKKELKPSPLASTPSPTPEPEEEVPKDQSEAMATKDDDNFSAHSCSAVLQRQQFRQRRKKRHNKSIEEAPELDRIEKLDSGT